jgi:predicted dehydrogenase
MRALVIGHKGSIGSRHFENLRSLCVDVVGVDRDDKLPLPHKFDFVVVATPTRLHLDYTKWALDNNLPVFLEKPITDKTDELDEYEKLIYSKHVMVACNLRFTSAIKMAKRIAEDAEVVSFHARISDNHINRKKYGEIVLQDIHEFDYISYLFGKLTRIEIVANAKRNCYDAIVVTKSGVQGTIHGDMLCESYQRELFIRTKTNSTNIPIDVSNSMYVGEMEYFINCVKTGLMPMNSLDEAISLTRNLIEAIHWSHNSSPINV